MTSDACFADPLINKGTAFSRDERRCLHLEGRFPSRVETLAEQACRVVANVHALTDPLQRYRYLSGVQNNDETLFYRAVLDHLDEMLPLIYTPTVGQACQAWSLIFERPRGLYISARQHAGRVADLLRNWPHPARMIVVTDGGRILGLGDLGANGMGIPIGKLALYTTCAGIPPEACLPITLDVGTDTTAVREDPLYLGDRCARLTGAAYDEFLEEFIVATQQVFPGAVVQFEDFNNASAFALLARYQDRLCCFDDDVQGTGAMGLAGLYTSSRLTGVPLHAQRLLFVGAGEACLGIGHLVTAALRREGVSESDAKARCLFIDSRGTVVTSRTDLEDQKRCFAQERAAHSGLVDAIEDFRPTVLIGACTRGAIFTQPVLDAMARLNDRPVIFALSNPTPNAECTAEQAYRWTAGRGIFASGSPFGPVALAGRTYISGQANNSFIFPGVGLGLLLSAARRVDDQGFLVAARALADSVTDEDLTQGRIFPPASRLRDVSLGVATAVADVSYQRGLASAPRPADLPAAARASMYAPTYRVTATGAVDADPLPQGAR